MTPLAHQIAKQRSTAPRRRTIRDEAGMLQHFDDVHCFECTAIQEMVCDLADKIIAEPEIVGRLAFLPAPRTWLEWVEDGVRQGVLLIQPDDEDGEPICAYVSFAMVNEDHPSGSHIITVSAEAVDDSADKRPVIPLFSRSRWIGPILEASDDRGRLTLARIYARLACINTPRVIGRRMHLPHAGLQKQIARSKGLVGKFPLRAWTEIELKVSPPSDESALPPRDGYLTGARALHFVRAFLRIRLGKLELVSAHWRGDASLGIKQTRYRLVPGEQAA